MDPTEATSTGEVAAARLTCPIYSVHGDSAVLVRLMTYASFSNPFVTSFSCAQAGFRYLEHEDALACTECKLMISNISQPFDPLALHQTCSEFCPLARDSTDVSAVSWADEVAAAGEGMVQLQHGDSELEVYEKRHWRRVNSILYGTLRDHLGVPVIAGMFYEKNRQQSFLYGEVVDDAAAQQLACRGLFLQEREDGDAVVCQFCSFSHPLIHESSLNVHEVLCQHDQRRCIPEGNIPDVLNPYLWDNLHTVPSTDANSEDNERQMADPKRRMATFLTWPRENTVSSEHLCAAGFYYTGTDDRVQCFSCGVQSSHWAPSEDPWVRHARSTRCCRHIEAKQGADYYRRVMNEFGPYTEKAAVIRNMTVTTRMLRPRMDSLPVQRALDMNIPNKDVTRVVTRRLQNRETDFNNAADIVREVSALNEVVRTDPQVPPVLPTICKSLRNKETTSDMMKAKFNWSCPDLQDCLKVVLGEEHWGEVIEKHTREGPGDLVDLPYLLKLVVSLLKEPNTAEEISVEQLTGRELINRITCKICLAHKIEVTFQPCGHFVCCSACAAAMTICPLCRQRITGSIKCRICY